MRAAGAVCFGTESCQGLMSERLLWKMAAFLIRRFEVRVDQKPAEVESMHRMRRAFTLDNGHGNHCWAKLANIRVDATKNTCLLELPLQFMVSLRFVLPDLHI